MTNSDWRSLERPHERLRWARLQWQNAANAVNASAKDAAESLGMEPGTYRAYERPPDASKHTRLDDQSAIRFAKKFRVSWVWLLTGDGSPADDDPPTESFLRVLRAMEKLPVGDREAFADMAEAFAKRAAAGGG